MIDAKGNYVPDPTPVASPIVQPTIPTPTPQQIYSAENIQSAATSPIAAPDLSNASSIYDFYMGGSGVSAARRQAEIDQKLIDAWLPPSPNYSVIIPIWTYCLRQVIQGNQKWQNTSFGRLAIENKKNMEIMEEILGREWVQMIIEQTKVMVTPLLKIYFICY